jgi:MFS family permease
MNELVWSGLLQAGPGLIGLTVAVWQVGILRALAWISRGVRSPARDSMLATLAPPHAYGRAFGLERAGDNLGAVAGPLLAAGMVAWIGIRPTLYLAAVPGVFAAIAITLAARAARRSLPDARRAIRIDVERLRRAGLLRPMLPVVAFEMGNVATTLLILRATQQLQSGGLAMTAAVSLAILIYAAHNGFGAAVAAAGGHWIDRSGWTWVQEAVGGPMPTHIELDVKGRSELHRYAKWRCPSVDAAAIETRRNTG